MIIKYNNFLIKKYIKLCPNKILERRFFFSWDREFIRRENKTVYIGYYQKNKKNIYHRATIITLIFNNSEYFDFGVSGLYNGFNICAVHNILMKNLHQLLEKKDIFKCL